MNDLTKLDNAFAPARILGCDAVDSIVLLDGMKLANDLVGEGKDVDALEVCCCIVDVARSKSGWQLSKKVSVNDRWWPKRGEAIFSRGERA